MRSKLADALLPQDCILCGQSSGKDPVCRACLDDLPRPPALACPACGDSSSGGPCGRCLKHPKHFDATIVAFAYEFPVDRLVHALKYGGHLQLAAWWAKQIAERIGKPPSGEIGSEARFDVLLPMPLHATRLAERGFNQAVEIGTLLARQLAIATSPDLCLRSRSTLPQAELDRKRRLVNVRGAFECRGNLTGLHVLAIDDVMSTGATLDEFARTLKLHGAARVTACVGARALTA